MPLPPAVEETPLPSPGEAYPSYGDCSDGAPQTAAAELAAHIEDCAAFFPGYLQCPWRAIGSIRAAVVPGPGRTTTTAAAAAQKSTTEPEAEGSAVFVEGPMCAEDRDACRRHLAAMPASAVLADIYMLPLPRCSDDSDIHRAAVITPPPVEEAKHLCVYFSYADGFLVRAAEGGVANEAEPPAYESLVSLLLHHDAH